MSLVESLMQAALTAPDDRKVEALRVLRGESAPEPVRQAPERFVTLKECARQLGVSACSLWRWQIPGHSLGGRRRFRVSEVEAYLKSDELAKLAKGLKEERREALREGR